MLYPIIFGYMAFELGYVQCQGLVVQMGRYHQKKGRIEFWCFPSLDQFGTPNDEIIKGATC